MTRNVTTADLPTDHPAAADVVAGLRRTFSSGVTRPLDWRRQQLRLLRAMLTERDAEIVAALHADLGKPETETHRAEIGGVLREIDETLAHLDDWLAPQDVPVPERLVGASASTVFDPLGVVLIIAPWNYPLNLLLVPAVGALAAGNCLLVKPSEIAPATSALLARLLPEYLDPTAVAVVEGGVPETTELLEQRFDHIFYTGNGVVGRVVMAAAAQHLTPVTLELGGKSPVFVDRDTNLTTVAERLVATKFANAGQTCVAPDYVLTDPETARGLTAALAEAVNELFGPNPADSTEYGRIVNDRHFQRLVSLLDFEHVAVGGQHDRGTRYIAPTVLTGVGPDAPVMREEIFGPILPILEVAGLDAAIDFINDRDKPLALYAFTNSAVVRQRLLTETSSGGLGFGLPVMQLTVPDLPFGGVGESGMGRYHGSYSIDTFSHRKAILDAPVD